jgi:hypothetical protein
VRVKVKRILGPATVLLGLLSLAHPARAQQDITVRLLHYRTGKPIKKVSVSIAFWNGEPFNENIVIKAKTDKNGQILVHVPEPVPEHLSMSSFDLFLSRDGVNSGIPMSPAEALKSGLVVPYEEGHSHSHSHLKVSAKPGQIVLFTRKLRWWNLQARSSQSQ